MISCTIMGGLGNQMFQIFAMMAYGIIKNVKVVFPYEYQINDRYTYWETFLNDFKLFTTGNEANQLSNEDIANFHLYNEQGFGYNPFPDFGDNNVRAHGFFQSYKYFENVKETIFKIMRLDDKKRDVKQKYSGYFWGDSDDASCDNADIISIHFRLGDYKRKRYYHPVMNYEYFEGALDHIMANKRATEKTRLLYYCESEDNEFVGNYIRRLNEKYPVLEALKVDDNIPDYDQMMIMSCSQHNIMSNSTFSWWGAYLNSYVDKIVCYPSVWFGEYYEHTHDHRDMMPDSWTKITSKPIPWDQPLV